MFGRNPPADPPTLSIGPDAANYVYRTMRDNWRVPTMLSMTGGFIDGAIEPSALILSDAAVLLDPVGGRPLIEKVREAGAVTRAEADLVIDTMEATSRTGDFFWALTFFTVSGRKPN
ncbi:MAG: hypothetical protein ACRDJW_14395 [Thermomicrobiales bacterium]